MSFEKFSLQAFALALSSNKPKTAEPEPLIFVPSAPLFLIIFLISSTEGRIIASEKELDIAFAVSKTDLFDRAEITVSVVNTGFALSLSY